MQIYRLLQLRPSLLRETQYVHPLHLVLKTLILLTQGVPLIENPLRRHKDHFRLQVLHLGVNVLLLSLDLLVGVQHEEGRGDGIRVSGGLLLGGREGSQLLVDLADLEI